MGYSRRLRMRGVILRAGARAWCSHLALACAPSHSYHDEPLRYDNLTGCTVVIIISNEYTLPGGGEGEGERIYWIGPECSKIDTKKSPMHPAEKERR
ncbi:hypothetical protein BJY52DRAFT_1301289 [Lactarius psammicola]|nr:hypothetical protein BJY52DRAFT_1301289 [Lactarius psammicola]